MSNATRTVREFMAAQLDADLYKSEFQKRGTISARIRQIVNTTSFYPSMIPTNSKSDNLFEDSEFGKVTEEQPFLSVENRIGFINVPETTTKEEVEKRLLALGDKARVYRELSNRPILTDEQKSAIKNGITTLEAIAESQAVRYPEGATDRITGEDVSGKLIKDTNGKIQYRAMFFSANAKPDADFRTPEADDYYITPDLQEEMEEAFFTAPSEINAPVNTPIPSGQEV